MAAHSCQGPPLGPYNGQSGRRTGSKIKNSQQTHFFGVLGGWTGPMMPEITPFVSRRRPFFCPSVTIFLAFCLCTDECLVECFLATKPLQPRRVQTKRRGRGQRGAEDGRPGSGRCIGANGPAKDRCGFKRGRNQTMHFLVVWGEPIAPGCCVTGKRQGRTCFLRQGPPCQGLDRRRARRSQPCIIAKPWMIPVPDFVACARCACFAVVPVHFLSSWLGTGSRTSWGEFQVRGWNMWLHVYPCLALFRPGFAPPTPENPSPSCCPLGGWK